MDHKKVNILLVDDQPAELAYDKQRYDDSMKGAYGAVDKLIALSDSSERRATNQKLRETVEAYFGVVNRANDAALGRDGETARRIALTEGRDARNRVREFVTPRIDTLKAELAKAKAEGRYQGRPATAQAKESEVKELHRQGVGATEIAKRLGIGRASVYRILAA